jgi:hypothetical protein
LDESVAFGDKTPIKGPGRKTLTEIMISIFMPDTNISLSKRREISAASSTRSTAAAVGTGTSPAFER